MPRGSADRTAERAAIDVAIALREAVETDVEVIARVHVEAWRETYAGLVRAETLAGLSVESRAGVWRSSFHPPRPRAKLLVAEAGGEIVGFGSAGEAEPGGLGTEAEVFALYLLDRMKRRGVGRRLMAALFAHLREHGFRSVGLWSFAANPPARRFYESLGGVAGPEHPWEFEGQALSALAYRFEPIPELGDSEVKGRKPFRAHSSSAE